jgi:hypothetical protein
MTLVASARWKEQLIITDENGCAFTFDCGWGVTPPVAYVPGPAEWAPSVPPWLRDRRSEVIAAMELTGHVVKDGPYPTWSGE